MILMMPLLLLLLPRALGSVNEMFGGDNQYDAFVATSTQQDEQRPLDVVDPVALCAQLQSKGFASCRADLRPYDPKYGARRGHAHAAVTVATATLSATWRRAHLAPTRHFNALSWALFACALT